MPNDGALPLDASRSRALAALVMFIVVGAAASWTLPPPDSLIRRQHAERVNNGRNHVRIAVQWLLEDDAICMLRTDGDPEPYTDSSDARLTMGSQGRNRRYVLGGTYAHVGCVLMPPFGVLASLGVQSLPPPQPAWRPSPCMERLRCRLASKSRKRLWAANRKRKALESEGIFVDRSRDYRWTP
jgi:hypothetical protein